MGTSLIAEPSFNAHLGNNDITSMRVAQGKPDSSMELVEHQRLTMVRIDSEQLRSSAAQHGAPFIGGQARRVQNVIDRRSSPRKRPVRPHYNLAGAALGDQMAQGFRSKDQGIEIKLPQIFTGMFLQRRWRAIGRGCRATVIGPRGVRRQVSATVRRADLETRKPVERAIENQMRQRKSGFQWIADYVAQITVPLETLL